MIIIIINIHCDSKHYWHKPPQNSLSNKNNNASIHEKNDNYFYEGRKNNHN